MQVRVVVSISPRVLLGSGVGQSMAILDMPQQQTLFIRHILQMICLQTTLTSVVGLQTSVSVQFDPHCPLHFDPSRHGGAL